MNAKKQIFCEHLIGVSILAAFLLPHTSVLLYVNPILCILLKIICGGNRMADAKWAVVIALGVSLLIALSSVVSAKSISRVVTLLLYFFCFPIVGSYRIRPIYLYLCLGVIVLSQLAVVYHISFVTNIMDLWYPISEADENYQSYVSSTINTENISDFRLGGLYRNSNQCAKYLTFLLAFFLCVSYEKSVRQHILFILVTYYAVILTGSRTGFVVVSLIVIMYIYRRKDINSIIKGVVTIATLAVLVFLSVSGSDIYRGLNVQTGFSNSLSAKYTTLFSYLDTEKSPLRLLFGYLDSALYKDMAVLGVMKSFDGELGDLIFSYGFFGLLMIVVYYISVFTKISKTSQIYIIILLWCISSTVICSYRASFIFMLLLSSIFSNDRGVGCSIAS